MKKIMILLLAAFLGGACSHEKSEAFVTFKVDLKKKPGKDFNEVYELKEVIRLETVDSSLMGNVAKVVAADDRLFLTSFGGQVVYMFNRQGKFLGAVNRQGRGPGEYVRMNDFAVLPEEKAVVIYDRNGKLVYYDWNGNFLREEKMTSYLAHLENLPSGGWLTNHGLMQISKFRNAQYTIRATNAQGRDIAGLDTLPKLQYSVPIKMVSVLAQDQGRYYAAPVIENTIYEYDWRDTVFIPRYKFQIADYLLPEGGEITDKDMLKGFFSKYYMLCREFVGQKTVLAVAIMISKGEAYTLVADKASEEVLVYSAYPRDEENEITLSAYMQHSGFDGQVVMYTTPLGLIDKKFKNPDSVGARLSRELGEEDNPILFVYKER